MSSAGASLRRKPLAPARSASNAYSSRSKVVRILIYDGNEIDDNTIGGNLACFRNSPAAQLGDHGGPLSIVGGRAIGECRELAA